MPLLSRRIPYDRRKLLATAESLRDTRRWRKALRLYCQVLAAEPRNAEIHARVAPLLARAGRRELAWESYRIASEALHQASEDAARLALHKRAARALPRSFEACRALARVEVADGAPDAAVETLITGASRLRGRKTRGQSIILLRDAREIEPWNPTVVLSLCRLLAREGRAAEALFLLDHLDGKARRRDRLAVRSLAFRIEPSLRHAWRWLTARRAENGQPLSDPRGSTTRRRTARV